MGVLGGKVGILEGEGTVCVAFMRFSGACARTVEGESSVGWGVCNDEGTEDIDGETVTDGETVGDEVEVDHV